MNGSIINLFYSTRLKYVGVLCILWGILAFFYKHYQHNLYDYNLLCGMLCWGLCFVFFSKEKTDDERIHMLKFHALTFGVPAGLMITHLLNYFCLNTQETGAGNLIESISAFQSIAIMLGISLTAFYFLKFKEEQE